MVQNRLIAGQQGPHWDKTNKELTLLTMVIYFVLFSQCVSPRAFLQPEDVWNANYDVSSKIQLHVTCVPMQLEGIPSSELCTTFDCLEIRMIDPCRCKDTCIVVQLVLFVDYTLERCLQSRKRPEFFCPVHQEKNYQRKCEYSNNRQQQ